MITCPCGMVVEETTSWPPYRFYTTNEEGEIIYAVCIHGCVVIDKQKISLEPSTHYYRSKDDNS